MTLYVVAKQHVIAQQWITREGLALSGPVICADTGLPLRGIGREGTVVVLLTPWLDPLSMELEQDLSVIAQTGTPVIRLNPESQHGPLDVAPTEVSFEPPEFTTAEEALEWLDKMETVRQRLQEQYRTRQAQAYAMAKGQVAGMVTAALAKYPRP